MAAHSLTHFLSRRAVKRLTAIAALAEKHESAVLPLTDADLRAKFWAVGSLSKSNLPLALAVVREAAKRALGLRPFAVQLMGAAALFDGVIAEMKTGEGKTLTIALGAALAALDKAGVHVATVNPYLAQRDADSMRPLYEVLGLTVGVALSGMTTAEKRAAYNADVTYALHSELGFDYLRDNMIVEPSMVVQRAQRFVIVDEADSILIDEARTPLIISQLTAEDSGWYLLADEIVGSLTRNRDFEIDEKLRAANFTDAGLSAVEQTLKQRGVIASEKGLYEPKNLHLMRYLSASLRAHSLYKLNRDYIIRDGAILIVDEATGRILEGRQWQEGLHQAIETKERLSIKPETETAAEITYQSLFKLYDKMSGLTGTALTAAEEFQDMYGLSVIPIPTNKPMIRTDLPDLIFRDKRSKFAAIAADIRARVAAGQPVLVGTASVQESEELSLALNSAGIAHRILNARQNAQEAHIISQAGRPGNVTVATNMAGRGTDIVLGGHDEDKEIRATRNATVLSAGGLHVLATQRHESRRVDDQLRGRAGRQGDPGSSQFYLSLDDELLRVFGSSRLERVFKFAGITTEALSNNTLDNAVRQAQAKLEGRNFESRKSLAKYDTVLAAQRQIVYAHRRQILNGDVRISDCLPFVEQAALVLAERYAPLTEYQENWDLKTLKDALQQEFGANVPLLRWVNVEELDSEVIHRKIVEEALAAFSEARADNPDFTEVDRHMLLRIIDDLWRGHLTHLSEMRESIHFRGYASQDPVTAYKREAFNAFTSLWKALELRIAQALVNPPIPEVPLVIEVGATESKVSINGPAPGAAPYNRVSRNEMCPCGSGLRYKHCHGKIA